MRNKFLAFCFTVISFSNSALAGVNNWTGIGPYGGQIRDIKFEPNNSTTLYTATAGGVFKSTDDGQTWAINRAGFTYALAISDDASSIFAGFSTGLRVSTDSGSTWLPVTLPSSNSLTITDLDLSGQTLFARKSNNDLLLSTDLGANFTRLPSFTATTTINSIAIDRSNSSRLYLTTNIGIYISSDSGTNWSSATLPSGYENVSDIAHDPNNPTIFYASTSAGVLKSIDTANNWSAVSTDTLLSTVAVDPQNSNIVYAANDISSGNVYRSSDAGANWSQVASGIRAITLSVHPTTANKLFIGNIEELLVSTDSGANWLSSSTGIQASTPSFVKVHPVTREVYAGGISNKGLYSSQPNNILSLVAGVNATPVYTLAFDSLDSDTLYAGGFGLGSSGGVYKTSNAGTSWQRNVSGLPTTGILSLAVSPLDSDFILAGTVDSPFHTNNLSESSNGTTTWQQINNSLFNNEDVQSLAFDPTNDNIIYAATDTGGILKSIDKGATWSSSNTGLPTTQVINGNPVTNIDEIIINPHDNNDIWAFFGDQKFRSTDAAASWSEYLPFTVDGHNIAFHPTDSSTFYIGNYQTRDSGTTWCRINTGLSSASSVEKVAIDNSNPDTLYVTTQYNGVYSIELTDEPPTASAGDDFTFTSATSTNVNLDASASVDNGGCIVSYEWTQLSGPTINNPPNNASFSSFIASSNGTYEFELRVTDNDGNTSTDTILITVNSSALNNNNNSGGSSGGGGGSTSLILFILSLTLLMLRQISPARFRETN